MTQWMPSAIIVGVALPLLALEVNAVECCDEDDVATVVIVPTDYNLYAHSSVQPKPVDTCTSRN